MCGESPPQGPKMTQDCKFCKRSEYEEESQTLYCELRKVDIASASWTAKHCGFYELGEEFKFKEETPTLHGNLHNFDANKAVGVSNTSAKPGEYINIKWDSPIEQINKKTKNIKAYKLKGSIPFGVVTYSADPGTMVDIHGNTLIKGDLTVEGEIKMVAIDNKIKDKQEKINQILKARQKYIEEWIRDFYKLDTKIIQTFILNYDWLRKEFMKYILNNVKKKSKKTIKKALEGLRIDKGYECIKGKMDGNRKNITLMSGNYWVFHKKLLAIIKKYATSYTNDALKDKYEELTSEYDSLLYDDEMCICEKCGYENQILVTFCSNCGTRLI